MFLFIIRVNSSPGIDLRKVQERHFRRLHFPEMTLRTWVWILGLTLVCGLLMQASVIETFQIPSSSMKPTLLQGDHILVNKLSFELRLPLIKKSVLHFQSPHRGDIVVFSQQDARENSYWPEGKYFIKRVIAVPGDEVKVVEHRVYINEVREKEAFARMESSDANDKRVVPNFGPLKLGPGEFFVMGDNRAHSHDSRFFGKILSGDILGRAAFIYWSWHSPQDYRVRWERVGKKIN